jgi:hypothetical protein
MGSIYVEELGLVWRPLYRFSKAKIFVAKSEVKLFFDKSLDLKIHTKKPLSSKVAFCLKGCF